MLEPFDIPHMPYEEIRGKADAFLDKYHRSRATPIPIEEIIEFQLRLEIIPIPGLQKLILTEGFTYGNQKSIAVDEFIFQERINRYRFTLAHEVGHIILHPQFFRHHDFNSLTDWKQYYLSLPEYQQNPMEWQANCFAGLILAPKIQLEEKLQETVKSLNAKQIPKQTTTDFLRDLIEEKISVQFEVSTAVIHIRFQRDKIYESYNLNKLLGNE